MAVEAVATVMGEGVVLTIQTSENGHIGAVAIAEPDQSDGGRDRAGATTSVIAIHGCKDEGIAQEVANQMASELGERVVVTCGLANADATPQQIGEMQLSARAVMDAVSGQVRMARREA
jgi:hypothetical protein